MAALLEMNTSPAEPEPALQVKTPQRFTYPSGSRPLEGYTIKRGVGRGGFGEVYFAVSDAGKEVALKLIRRNLEVEIRGVTHCLNLKHPNLVALYDIRTDEHDDRWVVMEYVSGESLEDVIQRHVDGMPRELAVKWFEGICAAVDYLHDHGIVHRDLKPANIFIDDGIVKIGDYGLSKFISCSRRSGQTESVGTVHYMAPEIANGRYGREIDAYALGIILFEMLTGHVPFEGESVGEVLMKHLTAEPTLDAIDEPFRSVVSGAMAKDPERRINNAAQMMDMLRGVQRPAAATFDRTVVLEKPSSPQTAERVHPQRVASASPNQHSPGADLGSFFIFMEREPIAEAFKAGLRGMRRDLNFDSWSRLSRVSAGIVMAIVLATTWWIWMPIGFVLGATYLFYRVVRWFIRSAGDVRNYQAPPHAAREPVAEPHSPMAVAAGSETVAPADGMPAADSELRTTVKWKTSMRGTQAPWRRRVSAGWRQAAYQELASRPLRERLSGIVGSMLAAGIIAPAASLLICMLLTPELPLELMLWTAAVATLSSWALMIPGQLAEGRMEDHAPLRFLQLVLGAVVGMIAFTIADAMYLKLPTSHDFAPQPHDTLASEMFNQRYEAVNAAYHSGSVQLPVAMYAAYFACLFVILRWWRMAEWTRSYRVSLWALAWCGFIAWGTTFFWWFPQPLGLMLAAVIAFTVQLASPWLSPSRRRELAQKVA
jgi:serine/threonine protein kinase